MTTNTVTQAQIDELILNAKIEYQKFGNRTLVGFIELSNGWIEVIDSTCIDASNFDEEIGKEIILERLSNKLWELEAYVLNAKIN